MALIYLLKDDLFNEQDKDRSLYASTALIINECRFVKNTPILYSKETMKYSINLEILHHYFAD